MILCVNPQASYLARQAEIFAVIRRVLNMGWFVLGAEVAAFPCPYTCGRPTAGVAEARRAAGNRAPDERSHFPAALPELTEIQQLAVVRAVDEFKPV